MAGGRLDGSIKQAILESSIFLAPSLILAVQMSGKGFANSFKAGGEVGLLIIWGVALALIFKLAIVDGLARFTLARGDSIFSGLPALPGPRNWAAWAVIGVYCIELMAYASMALYCGAVLEGLLPSYEPVPLMAIILVLGVLVLLLFRSLGFLDKMVYAIVAVVISLMIYSLVAAFMGGPDLVHSAPVDTSAIIENVNLLIGTGSGLALLLYSVWLSEKIRKIPQGMSKKQALRGVRIGLVFAFVITGVFSLIIMTVAASAGSSDIADLEWKSIGPLPFSSPVFILAVSILMFGIVYVGIDGRARAISRMLNQMKLTKMGKVQLYRVLVLCFASILLAALIVGQPTELLAFISTLSSVMFALAGFSLVYLNTKLAPPYRAGRVWTAVALIGSSVFLTIALVHERTFLEFGVPMLLRLAVVVFVLMLMVRYGCLSWAVRNSHRLRGALLMVIIFGAISVFGTVGGVEYGGAVINFRDLGPIMAGILGGPVVGALVGLVGGAYRYGMGGWTALACFVATVSAGLVSGLLSRYWRGSLSYLKLGFLGLLVEGMHLFLYFPLLTLGYPFSDVLDTLRNVAVPMIVTNLVGLMIFHYYLDRWGMEARSSDSLWLRGEETERA